MVLVNDNIGISCYCYSPWTRDIYCIALKALRNMANGCLKFDVSTRRQIVPLLLKRNVREKEPFEVLITTYNSLFDGVSELRHQVLQLAVENDKIRHENQVNFSACCQDTLENSAVADKVKELAHQVKKLDEEKSADAQKLDSLFQHLSENEKKLILKEAQLLEAAKTITSLRDDKRKIEILLVENEESSQTLKEEYEAIHLAFKALEAKLFQLQTENTKLLEKLISYKALHAELLHRESENSQKTKEVEVAEEAHEIEDGIGPETLGGLGYYNGPLISFDLPCKVHSKFDAHESEVQALHFCPSGRMLATGGGDRDIKLWDVGQIQCVYKDTISGSNAGITSVQFDSTGTLLLAASNDSASRVWNVTDKRLLHVLTGHTGKVLASRFFDDNSSVVSGSYDRKLKIWDLKTKACISTKSTRSVCNDVIINGVQFISAHADQHIRFWDRRSDDCRNEIAMQGKVTSLDISRDHTYLLACVRDDTLVTADLRMHNRIVSTFSHDEFRVSCDWARASFSNSGDYVSAGSADGSVFIFNATSAKLEKVLKEHRSPVIAVTWHPFDYALVSCDKNKRVIIWADSSY